MPSLSKWANQEKSHSTGRELLEDWLARQESLRKRGLAVDPLFTHYRSFMAKYK
jgi:hypothetical protein